MRINRLVSTALARRSAGAAARRALVPFGMAKTRAMASVPRLIEAWWGVARAALALVVLQGVAVSSAQTLPDGAPLPEAAVAAMRRGAELAERGLADPTPPHPDHPVWREVLAAAREAVAVVDHAATQRYLARAYGLTGWSSRSLALFDALVDGGHPLDAPVRWLVSEVSALELYARAAADMGFARYEAGDREGAEVVYARWNALDPDAAEALRWLGRLALEGGRPEAALPYWQRLVERLPDDEAAAYQLRETMREVAVGPAAAAAFRDGIAAYEAGRVAVAFEAFEAAHAANPDYVDAAVWAGRTALELDRPGTAARYWALVVGARPEDGGARYFLRLAEDQRDHGVVAGRAFHDGLARYERGDLEGASASFESAVVANADYLQAWVWLARTRQELGAYQGAVRAWERVMALDPSDERARYFATLAIAQQGVSPAAGQVFAEAVAAYEAADFARADRLFREVVAIDPGSATAWGWLGRVAFGERRFGDAADAYARASALDPSDDDLAFFAREAASLAGREVEPPPSDPASDGVHGDETEGPP